MAEDLRAVLLGMNNPHGVDPRYALYPHPPGCAGWRLWQLLATRVPGVTRRQYRDGFERVNLVENRTWSATKARARAAEFTSLWRGRTVVVLGEDVRRAIGLPKMLVHPQNIDGVEWRQLPHPSGRCRWYNSPECRDLAASLLAELYHRGGE